MNAMVPNNGLALLTTRTMGETAGLRRLAEETRVAIALLNYQVGQARPAALSGARGSQIKNIVTGKVVQGLAFIRNAKGR